MPFAQTAKRLNKLNSDKNLHFATFAGGCFWCMEAPFEHVDGVKEVIAGYAGGTTVRPTYEQVIEGKTGHKESVQIFYNPKEITFKELVDIFWLQIDPTDTGGQFADRGTQYQTAIFYNSDEEKQISEKSKTELNNTKRYQQPIATQIIPFTNFYPAEDYHQGFYLKNADHYYRYEMLSGRQKYKEEIKKKILNNS